MKMMSAYETFIALGYSDEDARLLAAAAEDVYDYIEDAPPPMSASQATEALTKMLRLICGEE